MHEATFRSLERFNIRYDIAIDQEDFNSGRQSIKFFKLGPLVEIPSTEFENSFGRSATRLAEHEVGQLRLQDQTVSHMLGPETPWFNLLLAKRVRAYFQEEGNPPDSLNEVARFLLMHLPQKDVKNTDELAKLSVEQRDEYHQLKILRILYLNEISAGHKKELSIGYADMAIAFISEIERAEKLAKGGNIIYELVALFNAGRGHQHAQQAQQALVWLDQVIAGKNNMLDWVEWLDEHPNMYISEDHGYGKISETDLALWVEYIFIPAN